MKNVITINATDVRNDWSAVVDSVVRDKPKFIKRTRDYMFLSDIKIVENILEAYNFTAQKFVEDDGSITLCLNEIEDLAENGGDEREAVLNLAKGILEYAEIFYDDFNYWAVGDRISHIPYVFKALILNDAEKIGGLITCRPGKI